jgi:hypothetical protein
MAAFRQLVPCERILQKQQQQQQRQQPRKLTRLQATNLLLQQYDTLLPRCYAVALTLQAEAKMQKAHLKATKKKTADATAQATSLPWINVKFTELAARPLLANMGLTMLLGNYTSPANMAQYKYQIDFGGMGGTTWLGTITKLAMPGLLFHHDTPAMDWFHDEIQPWVHYVPIHTNLSNLYDMYVWAETHPDQAKQIAQRGQAYARQHVIHDNLQKTFDQLYVERLGHIVDAYQPSSKSSGGETIDSILQKYKDDGLFLKQLTTSCTPRQCLWKIKPFWLPR